MEIKYLNSTVSVSGQIGLDDIATLKRQGVKLLICNRPDKEEDEQPELDQIRSAASLHRISTLFIPFVDQAITLNDIEQMANVLEMGRRVHMYCRSGQRSSLLWALAEAKLGRKEESIVDAVKAAGYKLKVSKLNELISSILIANVNESPISDFALRRVKYFDVVIVGGGSGGLTAAASLRKRDKSMTVAIVDPGANLYYQPGWTMVGGGIFNASSTRRQRRRYIPQGVTWLRHSVEKFTPERSLVRLDSGNMVHYQQLIIATGLELQWDGVEGLKDAIGRDGVTSNYRYDLAPYTWELVQSTKQGRAIFTQPSMPIKCAGAPQKAMYLSADYWFENEILSDIDVTFCSAGDTIFGVPDYVPALNQYLQKYNVDVRFQHNLVRVDGPNRTAYFSAPDTRDPIALKYEMLHVCPPQRAVKCVRESTLADENGWLSIDQNTLRHTEFDNIWGVGDVINSPNAKTLAAVRKQAPVVANNVIGALAGHEPTSLYSGYGSCPLTVERGKIVLAEFIYGGEHSPTFPSWINDGKRPTAFGWVLKKSVLPWVYWSLMLRGREWLAKPIKKTELKDHS